MTAWWARFRFMRRRHQRRHGGLWWRSTAYTTRGRIVSRWHWSKDGNDMHYECSSGDEVELWFTVENPL